MGLIARRSPALRVLIVDADSDCRRLLRTSLEARIARPMMILETADADTARAMTGDKSFDVLILDIASLSGTGSLAGLIGRASGATIFVTGGAQDVAGAVAAIKAGASDYLEKPLDGAAFARRIEHLFVENDLRGIDRFEGLAGRSAAMKSLFDQIDRVANAPLPVFVAGETGSGKALVARAIHERSRRRTMPFVTVECAGLDSAQLWSALFRDGGAMDRAAGGSLYLDEVSQLPTETQGLLLRLLDGADIDDGERVKINSARVLASSNCPRDLLCSAGGMRSDLFFRLTALPIAVPALRDRLDDIPLLVEDLQRSRHRGSSPRLKLLDETALAELCRHDWPGNIRELKSVLDQVISSCPGEKVTADHVAGHLPVAAVKSEPAKEPVILPLWMQEQKIIDDAIAAFGGNIAKAATALGISPSTIYRKKRPEAGDPIAEAS